MDYKEKVIAILNSQELSKEQKEKLESIFPELAEPEDKRIRKEMIEILKQEAKDFPSSIIAEKSNKWIAWLEKQGEQKPVPKFKIGDTMRTLQEAADGFIDGMPVVVSIDEEYYHCNNELIAIKDQNSYEYPPMNRIQKPAWSEDDEYYYGIIQYILNNECVGKTDKEEAINWLKSLRPQNRWKPSDEQMEALEHFVRSVGESGYASPYDNNTKLLYSLLSDLKKLKE